MPCVPSLWLLRKGRSLRLLFPYLMGRSFTVPIIFCNGCACYIEIYNILVRYIVLNSMLTASLLRKSFSMLCYSTTSLLHMVSAFGTSCFTVSLRARYLGSQDLLTSFFVAHYITHQHEQTQFTPSQNHYIPIFCFTVHYISTTYCSKP